MRVPECQQRGLSLLEDLQHFFHQDEFSDLVQAWNEQRSMVLKEAVERFLQPQIFKEIQEKLLELSQEAVLKVWFFCAKLHQSSQNVNKEALCAFKFRWVDF